MKDMPTLSAHPLVSVIIPTKNRPQLLTKAIESVLAQSYPNLEIVVVVDGPDPATTVVLNRYADTHRVRHLTNHQSVGPAEARNRGVREAKGDWIAFLDDDDEWLADKLHIQMGEVAGSKAAYPVAFSQVLVRDGSSERVWPRRGPRAGEDLGEYLFARNSLRQGEGIILPSTWLLPRALIKNIPFDSRLIRHEDSDWLLRVTRRDDVKLLFTAIPLAIWNTEPNRQRVSTDHDWRYWLAWARERRELLSRRAYAGWLLQTVAGHAVLAGQRRALWGIWWEAWTLGSPGLLEVLVFVAMAMPQGMLRSLRLLLQSKRPPSA